MKKFKYRDKAGKIHTLRNVQLWTGCRDVNGEDIYEGDVVEVPCYTRPFSSKRKTKLVKKLVRISENGKSIRKTVGGSEIYNPIEVRASCVDPLDREYGCNSWHDLFKARLVKDSPADRKPKKKAKKKAKPKA